MSGQSASPEYTPNDIWPLFQAYLPAAVISGFYAKLAQRFYQRVFGPLAIVWGFLFQRLNPDHTCDAYVSYLTSSRPFGLAPTRRISENTAAYCQARKRLPVSVAQQALQYTAQTLREQNGAQALWHGRATFLLDGSTLRLKAEEELIAHYGRPAGRRGASYWPVMRIVGAFDLWSGALQAIQEGAYSDTEVALAAMLFPHLPPGGVVVADQLFGIYRVLQELLAARLEGVFRIQVHHLGRWNTPPLRPGEDREVTWSPSANDQTNPDLPTPTVRGRLLDVRVERDGFRPLDVYLFTTLTDRTQFPCADIAQLYACRYQVELDLRHVKTTLQMEALDSKSVEIVQKELFLGLTAYNLIRALMVEAALRAGCEPLALSLARCWRRITDTARSLALLPPPLLAAFGPLCIEELLDRLATCRLPQRSKPRYEPRAVRATPQPFPILHGSREEARKQLIQQWQEY